MLTWFNSRLGPSHVASQPGKQLQCILHGRHHHIDKTERGIAFRSCTDSSLCYTQTFFFLRKRSENVNRTNVSTIPMEPVKKHYLQHGKGSLHGEIYLSFNKSKREKEQHGETTRRGAGSGWAEGKGNERRDEWYVHVCKPLQVSQQKAWWCGACCEAQELGAGRWCSGLLGFVCSLFFLSVLLFCYFTLFRWLVGFKIGVKTLPSPSQPTAI